MYKPVDDEFEGGDLWPLVLVAAILMVSVGGFVAGLLYVSK